MQFFASAFFFRIFEENNTPMKLAALFFFVFGIMSICLGIAMLMNDTLLIQFGSTVRIIFIVLLFGYGIYRVMAGVSTIKKASQRQDAK